MAHHDDGDVTPSTLSIIEYTRGSPPLQGQEARAALFIYRSLNVERWGAVGGNSEKLWMIIVSRCLWSGTARCSGGQTWRYTHPQEHKHICLARKPYLGYLGYDKCVATVHL